MLWDYCELLTTWLWQLKTVGIISRHTRNRFWMCPDNSINTFSRQLAKIPTKEISCAFALDFSYLLMRKRPSQICTLSELENRLWWWPFQYPTQILFLTMSYHSLYLLQEIGMAESVCTHSILVWNVWALYQKFHHPMTRKPGCGDGWWLWKMNSNLHLLQPFIMLTVTHWKGWNAVNCLIQSVHTQSGCEK